MGRSLSGGFTITARKRLAPILGLILGAGILAPAPALAVTPGSVTPVFNNTPGISTFAFGANATGWYRGTISVSYTLYDGPSSTGPWSTYFSDSRTCVSSTGCNTATGIGTCSNGWYKLVAHASGPGGSAQNNGAYVVHYVHGTISTVAPQAQNASLGTLVPAWISSECKVHYTPI
jgi:hypothetical protein